MFLLCILLAKISSIIRKKFQVIISQRKPFLELDFITIVIFWPSTRPQKMLFQGDTPEGSGHIPMASNRKRSRGRIKAYDMGQGEGPIVPLQWCTGRE